MSLSSRILLSSLLGLTSHLAGRDAAAEPQRYLTPAEAVPRGTAPGARARLLSETNGRKTYALILSGGDEVFTALTEFARRNGIRAAHFTGIGAVRDVELGWYDLSRKAYKVSAVPGQVEAVSLIGDIGVADGNPAVHTHLVVGLPDGQTRGGHLLHAVASPTLEVFLTEEPSTLVKTRDETSGLWLFNLHD